VLRIGEFARVSGVSAKSLRHYDAIGLFRPVWVEPVSGYRYYSPTQLPELYRIVALKELGIPLAEVAGLIGEGTDLTAVLSRRRTELEAERVTLERRLAALDIRFDRDGRSAHPDVVMRRIEPELVAGLRVRLEPSDDLEPVFDELEAYVRDAGARAARPSATLVHEELANGIREVEPVVPLVRRVPATDRIGCRRLPGVRAAAVIHRGPYQGLAEARRSLTGWMRASGLEPTGPLRIVYLQFGANPELAIPNHLLANSAEGFVTEIQQPLAG
jgi:DNA-binding transcriptional MerR regulator